MDKNDKKTNKLYTDADIEQALKDLQKSKAKIRDMIRQVKNLKITIFKTY